MPKYQYRGQTMSVPDAVSYAWGELESLGQEIREVLDNTPENLLGSQRNQTLEETASNIENMSEPDAANPFVSAIEIQVTFSEATHKRGVSRGTRRDNAVSALEAVIHALTEADEEKYQELIDELEEFKSAADELEFPGMYG